MAYGKRGTGRTGSVRKRGSVSRVAGKRTATRSRTGTKRAGAARRGNGPRQMMQVVLHPSSIAALMGQPVQPPEVAGAAMRVAAQPAPRKRRF